ncbi:MAG: bifunctional pyr operon transcriptional regulator/uracil phosphoribosyltransferase PyrR [Acidiferrobacterales bacterium]
MSLDIDVDATLEQIAEQLRPLLDSRPLMIGIHTGGVWLAERLHKLLGLDEPLGTLDISFYRDDFTRIGLNPQVKASDLPFDMEDRNIILVDDVLHTGRTIRAALNEIFDYGRPASVKLVVLINRGGHELPIQADVVGKTVELKPGEQIKLTGPDKLALEIQGVR